jgi:hypothetical protein
MPWVRGFLRVVTHDRFGRPVDPGYGVDEGEPGPGDPGSPDQGLPGHPGRPSHGLPWPGRPVDPGFGWGGPPVRPGHGLPHPGRPVDPGWGVDEGGPEIPGLPGIPDQGPVIPARPGHPLPRPPLPVVASVPLPEDEELPTGKPHLPGCFAVVVDGKSNRKALGWLQGEAALPPDEGPEAAIPAPGRPPGSGGRVGGHWVAVSVDPVNACGDEDGSCAFAYIFEIDANFGLKPQPK